MVSLAVRDETTGQIKPWVWVVGAGFAIVGAALFLGTGKSSNSDPNETPTEGLGSAGGLDSLQEAILKLLDTIDDMGPAPSGGGSGGGGGGSGGGSGSGSGSDTSRPVRGVPTPTDTTTRSEPIVGTIGSRSEPIVGSRRIAPATIISSGPSRVGPLGSISTGRTPTTTASIPIAGSRSSGAPVVTAEPTSLFTSTVRTISPAPRARSAPSTAAPRAAVSTGSINPYPISKNVNASPRVGATFNDL